MERGRVDAETDAESSKAEAVHKENIVNNPLKVLLFFGLPLRSAAKLSASFCCLSFSRTTLEHFYDRLERRRVIESKLERPCIIFEVGSGNLSSSESVLSVSNSSETLERSSSETLGRASSETLGSSSSGATVESLDGSTMYPPN